MEVTQEQPQQHEEIEGQGFDTQEPAPPNILVEVSTQIGADEPETENIPNFNEEFYDVTPKPSRAHN